VTDSRKGGHCYLHGNEGNNSFNCRNLATPTREINPLLGNVATTENELFRCRYNKYVKGLFASLCRGEISQFQASLQGERTSTDRSVLSCN
jgi:hypothetical protein